MKAEMKGEIIRLRRVIDNLQETIKLMQFDKTKDREKIEDLKISIASRDKTIVRIKNQLIMMARQGDYSNMSQVLNALRGNNNEE